MKNCVILTTTSNGEGLEYYSFENKNFDLFVIDYTSGIDSSPISSDHIAKVFATQGGFKYHNIKLLLMAKLYSKKNVRSKRTLPSNETISFLLNYSKALTIKKVGKITFEIIAN